MISRRLGWILATLVAVAFFNPPIPVTATASDNPDPRLDEVRARVEPGLKQRWNEAGREWGCPVYLRGFKESDELELWAPVEGEARWTRWAVYPIASWSGVLGPKLAEGDRQTPEGCYATTSGLLNPKSRYHLSFNIGYPNAYDRHHDRTGSFIMVHGSNVSIGCLAMTDPVIEEIYLLVEAALHHGQKEVPIHLFPFHLTDEQLDSRKDHTWHSFWLQELRPVYDAFEEHRRPPLVRQLQGRYSVEPSEGSSSD